MEHDTAVNRVRSIISHLFIPSSQTEFSASQSQRSLVELVDTNRGNLAENATSTSILGSASETTPLDDTIRLIHTSEGTSRSLEQIYLGVTSAYRSYIQLMDFLPDSQELRMGLVIECYRTDLWGRRVMQGYLPTHDIKLSALCEAVLSKMLYSFSEIQHTVEKYGTQFDIKGLAGVLKKVSLQQSEHSHEGSELPKRISTATRLRPENTVTTVRKLKFALLEKTRMKRLVQDLSYWNDSLERLIPTLERESLRRRLRAHFSSSNTAELQILEAAAAFLKHQDIECMATARSVIEEEEYGGQLGVSQLQASDNLPLPPPPEYRLQAENWPSSPPPEYRLRIDELEWQEVPYRADPTDRTKPRAMATLRGESVIVDWQYCENDSWRREHPAAFRRRTENLTTILNTGLRPLNLSVLHCVGYLQKASNITGYAFRLPPGVEPGQKPATLHHLLYNVRKADDVPDLGDRYQLAKALVSTVFEIHNLGWLHKNIQPINILFWPKPNSTATIDISKPYLMGFDISIPNQPGEFTEKPSTCPGDELYRHPLYRGAEPHSFQPSFDIYSLGIVLYEIGVWRPITAASPGAPGKSRLDSEYIDTLVTNGAVGGLKRFMGVKYRDVVMACLRREFDDIWKQQEVEREKRLHIYLDQVQNRVVDPINVCSA